jgi:hypothetical protein
MWRGVGVANHVSVSYACRSASSGLGEGHVRNEAKREKGLFKPLIKIDNGTSA